MNQKSLYLKMKKEYFKLIAGANHKDLTQIESLVQHIKSFIKNDEEMKNIYYKTIGI